MNHRRGEEKTYGPRVGHDDAIPLDEAEPAPHVPGEVSEVPIDDSEEQDRVRRLEPVEQALDRRLDGIGDGREIGRAHV